MERELITTELRRLQMASEDQRICRGVQLVVCGALGFSREIAPGAFADAIVQEQRAGAVES